MEEGGLGGGVHPIVRALALYYCNGFTFGAEQALIEGLLPGEIDLGRVRAYSGRRKASRGHLSWESACSFKTICKLYIDTIVGLIAGTLYYSYLVSYEFSYELSLL